MPREATKYQVRESMCKDVKKHISYLGFTIRRWNATQYYYQVRHSARLDEKPTKSFKNYVTGRDNGKGWKNKALHA